MSTPYLPELHETLRQSVEALRDNADQVVPAEDRYAFAAPRNPEHGDLATNAGLLLSKVLGRHPLDLAGVLAEDLRRSPLIAEAQAAAPGFVNVRLSDRTLADLVNSIIVRAENYGAGTATEPERILLEFISANPTGPMHVGHLRHAVTGDVLCRLLRAAGHEVHTEFYVNDGGVQIEKVGRSFRARCLQAAGRDVAITEDMYPGEYLIPMAADYLQKNGLTQEQLDQMSVEEFGVEARGRCMKLIEDDLAILNITFDEFASERALYDKGAVFDTLELLRGSGMTYHHEGAEWLATTREGDDEDRVLVKSDKSLTYLVPDLAYHHQKFQRGYERFINIFGSDHIGYVSRLKAGIKALGHDPSRLEVVILRLVFLISADGERKRGSKRDGTIVYASELLSDVGNDVIRFFLLQRSTDSEMDFDLDLAKENSDRNPVYKVQYAHARIHSLFVKAKDAGLSPAADGDTAIAHLGHAVERELLLELGAYPAILRRCAEERAPHHLPNYLLGVAELWNRYWSAAKADPSLRIVVPEDPARSAARLRLAACARQVLANGLQLLGISAPDRLVRDEEE